jgi:uncharacterized protein (TIGR03435 family)
MQMQPAGFKMVSLQRVAARLNTAAAMRKFVGNDVTRATLDKIIILRRSIIRRNYARPVEQNCPLCSNWFFKLVVSGGAIHPTKIIAASSRSATIRDLWPGTDRLLAMRGKSAWKTLVAAIAISTALAAEKPPGSVEFEVVSIKPADPAAPAHMGQQTPAGFRGRNLRLFELIMSAWHLTRDQIIGGPNWLETAGWDIDARFPVGTDPAQAPQMMQSMLSDRFHLVTHRETRILPIYALTVAKGGPKLQQGDGRGGMSAGPRLIRYSSGSMGELAGQLSSYIGRYVTDRTGMTGKYAISLSFAPVDPGASTDDAAPSIFQALQEQAGLKLQSTRGPVEVMVIDHAERPEPN